MKQKFRFRFLPGMFLLIVLFLTSLFSGKCLAGDDERQQVLKIYNWADYIDEDLLTEFPKWYKEQTGEDEKGEKPEIPLHGCLR